MPQPYRIRHGENLDVGPRVISARPACAVGIARVCAAWAEVEDHLEGFLGHAIATWKREGPGLHSGTGNHVAMQAYRSFDTLHARMTMVSAMCSTVLTEAGYQKLQALLSEMRKAGRKRHTIAHGRWMITKNRPDDLLRITRDPEVCDRYTPNDFEALVSQLDDLGMRICAARYELVPLP